jgi:hypothetical protein
MSTNEKQTPQAHSVDTLAAIIGSCALVLFAVWLSTFVGAFLTMAVAIGFFLSGKQRHLFDLIARPLHAILRTRANEGRGDNGFRKARFKTRPTLPVVIEHDPNEFPSKRG